MRKQRTLGAVAGLGSGEDSGGRGKTGFLVLGGRGKTGFLFLRGRGGWRCLCSPENQIICRGQNQALREGLHESCWVKLLAQRYWLERGWHLSFLGEI